MTMKMFGLRDNHRNKFVEFFPTGGSPRGKQHAAAKAISQWIEREVREQWRADLDAETLCRFEALNCWLNTFTNEWGEQVREWPYKERCHRHTYDAYRDVYYRVAHPLKMYTDVPVQLYQSETELNDILFYLYGIRDYRTLNYSLVPLGYIDLPELVPVIRADELAIFDQ